MLGGEKNLKCSIKAEKVNSSHPHNTSSVFNTCTNRKTGHYVLTSSQATVWRHLLTINSWLNIRPVAVQKALCSKSSQWSRRVQKPSNSQQNPYDSWMKLYQWLMLANQLMKKTQHVNKQITVELPGGAFLIFWSWLTHISSSCAQLTQPGPLAAERRLTINLYLTPGKTANKPTPKLSK